MKNRKILAAILGVLIGLGLLASCQTGSAPVGTVAPATADVVISEVQVTQVPQVEAEYAPGQFEPYAFRKSKPGSVTLHGFLVVLEPNSLLPGPNDDIYLAPLDLAADISMIPTVEIGQVPQADVDERTGEFVFTDIEPGKYAVVVQTMGAAQIPARMGDNSGLAIITVEEAQIDETIELGSLSFP